MYLSSAFFDVVLDVDVYMILGRARETGKGGEGERRSDKRRAKHREPQGREEGEEGEREDGGTGRGEREDERAGREKTKERERWG